VYQLGAELRAASVSTLVAIAAGSPPKEGFLRATTVRTSNSVIGGDR
jgi:hypothetical protein